MEIEAYYFQKELSDKINRFYHLIASSQWKFSYTITNTYLDIPVKLFIHIYAFSEYSNAKKVKYYVGFFLPYFAFQEVLNLSAFFNRIYYNIKYNITV